MNLVMFLMNQFGEQAVNFARPAPGQTNPCIFGGEGAPDMVAPENSLYVRLDASASDAYLYRNTDGADTWEAMSFASASDILATPITGFVSGAGTVAATDTILEAIEKLDGNNIATTATADAALPEADFTDAAVNAKLLTGLAAGANTPISATDSILVALANLQAQISAL